MTRYETNLSDRSSPDGVCERVANNGRSTLNQMWRVTEGSETEVAAAFGVDMDEVTLTDVEAGGKGHVSSRLQENLFKLIPRRFTGGVIHTHPSSDRTVELLMSPDDLNIHLQHSDRMGNYTSTLVLTQDSSNGEMVLYGFTNDPGAYQFADVQQVVTQKSREIDNTTTPMQRLQLLHEAYDAMEQLGHFCEVRF